MRHYPDDLAGDTTRQLCAGIDDGATLWPAALAALHARRQAIVDAVEDAVVDVGDLAAAPQNHPTLSFLRQLVAVHDSQATARGAYALADILHSLREPAVVAALAEHLPHLRGPSQAFHAAVLPDLAQDIWALWALPDEQQPRRAAGTLSAMVRDGVPRLDPAWATVADAVFAGAPSAWTALKPLTTVLLPVVGDLARAISSPSLQVAAVTPSLRTIAPALRRVGDDGLFGRLVAALSDQHNADAWRAAMAWAVAPENALLRADLEAVWARVIACPQRRERLEQAARQPAFAQMLAGMAQLAAHADAVAFDERDLGFGAMASYLVDGQPMDEVRLGRPANHARDASWESRSILRRILQMVHDGNALALANRPLAQLSVGGAQVACRYARGEIVSVPNMAHVYLKALAGPASFTMCLRGNDVANATTCGYWVNELHRWALLLGETLNETFELPSLTNGRPRRVVAQPADETTAQICRGREKDGSAWTSYRFEMDASSTARILMQLAPSASDSSGIFTQMLESPRIAGVDFSGRYAGTVAALELPGLEEGLALVTSAFLGPDALQESADTADSGLTLMVDLLEVLWAHFEALAGPSLADAEAIVADILPGVLFGEGLADAAPIAALLDLQQAATSATASWWQRDGARDDALANARHRLTAVGPQLRAEVAARGVDGAAVCAAVGRLAAAILDDERVDLDRVTAWMESPWSTAGRDLLAALVGSAEGERALARLAANVVTVDDGAMAALVGPRARALLEVVTTLLPQWLDPDHGAWPALVDLAREVRASDPEDFVPQLVARLVRPTGGRRPGAKAAPIAALAEAFAQVNRVDPNEQGPLDADDLALIFATLEDFLRCDQQGLMRFLALVERRRG